jgi:hypothetical protein
MCRGSIEQIEADKMVEAIRISCVLNKAEPSPPTIRIGEARTWESRLANSGQVLVKNLDRTQPKNIDRSRSMMVSWWVVGGE